MIKSGKQLYMLIIMNNIIKIEIKFRNLMDLFVKGYGTISRHSGQHGWDVGREK